MSSVSRRRLGGRNATASRAGMRRLPDSENCCTNTLFWWWWRWSAKVSLQGSHRVTEVIRSSGHEVTGQLGGRGVVGLITTQLAGEQFSNKTGCSVAC